MAIPTMAETGFVPLGLRDYAEQIVQVAGKTLAIKNLVYNSQEDLWSTCGIVATVTTGVVAANQSQRIFQLKPGETGQGFTVALTESETNNENGERFQGNETYIAVGIGFDFYAVSSIGNLEPIIDTGWSKAAGAAATPTVVAAQPLDTSDIAKLAMGLFWTHKVGGGPERAKGSLGQWPYGAGVFNNTPGGHTSTAGGSTAGYLIGSPSNGGPNVPMRRFDQALVFPPNIDVVLRIKSGTLLTLSTSADVAVRAYMRGFRLSVPV